MMKKGKIRTGKILRYFFLLLFVCLAIEAWLMIPILSGHVAKELCSDIFIANRTANDVEQNETGIFPFQLVSYSVNTKDSSVSASFLGFAKRKAIYRKGLGVTLINGIDETEIKKQAISIASHLPAFSDCAQFPLGNRLSDTINSEIDKAKLANAINNAFNEPDQKNERRTRSVIVVYKGKIIGEKYAAGFSIQTKQLGWSMTKSITNALLGILVKQGKLHIDSAAPIEQWENDARNRITIANLMQMNSGLRFWRFPAAPSDQLNMLFKEADMSKYAIDKPLQYQPGTVFNYSDGSANILSYIIRKKLGDTAYYRFPYVQLFNKIGMYHTILEVDPSGTFVGSSYCYATARDWARFGLLYLNDGVWNGERILPEGWVKFTATPSAAKNSSKAGKYGALWWSNAGDANDVSNRKYPHVPADCFSCQGYDGQFVWVIPSKQLVVVRLAFEKGDELDQDLFLSEIIKALPK